jgi:hypothetical protein
MTLPTLSLSQLIPDIKSDLVKSFVMGIVAIIVTAILSVVNDAMPSEFKQPAMIVAFGIIIALFSLAVILIKRHSSDIKIISSLVFSMLLVIVISVVAFFNYTYKGLFFETDNPIFIVFYPEQVSSPTLQNSIESSVPDVPEQLKSGKNYFPVKKVILPEKFDFEHSLLKRHTDKLTSVISYVLLIPEGEKLLIKTGFPAGLPYLKIGLQSVETASTYDRPPIKQAYLFDNDINVILNGYFGNFNIGLAIGQDYSKIHYGLKGNVIPNLSAALVGPQRHQFSNSDLSITSLQPVKFGTSAEGNAISGSIYFSLVSGMIDYYRIIGENKMICNILLEDYLGFDQIENVKKNLNFFPKERLFQCLKNISLENKKPLFDLLTVEQKNELQKTLLESLISGNKTQDYLVNTGLYDDNKALDIAYQMGKICRSKTNFYQTNHNIGKNWDFADCLHNLLLLQENHEIINQKPLIKNNIADIINNFYESDIMAVPPDILFNHVERLKNLYDIMEQENKFCDLDWSSLIIKIADKTDITLMFDKETDIKQILDKETGIKLLLDKEINAMQKISDISKCEKLKVFDFDIKPLLNQTGQDILKKLVDDVLTDWKNDVTVFTLLNHIKTNLLAVTSYLELHEVENITKEVLDAVLNNRETWLTEEFKNLTQRLHFPEEVSDIKVPSEVNKKISLVFQDISINDKISDWKNLLNKLKESKLFDGIDKNTLLNSALAKNKILDDYFIDSLAHQFFAIYKSWIIKSSGKNFPLIEYKKGKIYNRTLEKMILFSNLQNPSANSKQLGQFLQAIKDEYKKTDTVITDAQLKHYEFYVSFKNGDTVKALEALNSLVTINEYPYVDFYRFAKTVIESPNTIDVCQNNPDTAEKILNHLLSDDFYSKDWDYIYSLYSSKENNFNKILEVYLTGFVLDRKKDSLELATAFQNCGQVAKLIEIINKPKKDAP